MTQVLPDTDFDRIVDEHFAAELRGDIDATIATFTEDVEHDVVGSPAVSQGRAEAAAFVPSPVRRPAPCRDREGPPLPRSGLRRRRVDRARPRDRRTPRLRG